MRPIKIWPVVLAAILVSSQAISSSYANILSNSIEKTPTFSRNLEIFFIDLSGSVDYQVVTKGFENIRRNLAYIYEGSDVEKNLPANSYYRWIPIRGAEAMSADLPIFTDEDDLALWTAARKIKGKGNQVQVLRRLRETNGLWSRLMTAQNLDSRQCQIVAYNYLQSPGLSGTSFQRLNSEICSTALKVRARVKQVIDNIESYTKPVVVSGENGKTFTTTQRKTSGTDLFGTINKLENVARNSSFLSEFNVIRLVFVSDMLHNTDAINLRKTLTGKSLSESCQIAGDLAGNRNGFDSSKFFPTVYGLGEVREKKKSSTKAMEKRRPVLREFWDCYFKAKGLPIPDAEFRKLSTFTDRG